MRATDIRLMMRDHFASPLWLVNANVSMKTRKFQGWTIAEDRSPSGAARLVSQLLELALSEAERREREAAPSTNGGAV